VANWLRSRPIYGEYAEFVALEINIQDTLVGKNILFYWFSVFYRCIISIAYLFLSIWIFKYSYFKTQIKMQKSKIYIFKIVVVLCFMLWLFDNLKLWINKTKPLKVVKAKSWMEQNWQNRSFSRYSGQRCELAQNTPSMEPRKRANYQFFIMLTSKIMFMKNWILRKKGPP